MSLSRTSKRSTFMPFEKASSRVPSAIGAIEVNLRLEADGTTASSSTNIEVLDAQGRVIRTVSTELDPHLTTAQKNTAKTFLTNLRTKAISEVLP